jgi:hypothetical protein
MQVSCFSPAAEARNLEGGSTMGIKVVDVLPHVKIDGLKKEDKAALKKKLQAHKVQLNKAIKEVDKGLAALAKKPKGKK